MSQSEFRSETCGSPHVSILNNLSPHSHVLCRTYRSPIRTWAQYGRATKMAFSNDYIHSRIVGDPLAEGGFPMRLVQ